ncbi:MAG TPA: translocation/assembly module TamB domain-containing protein, partial [Chitinophagaceae bacterium]
NKITLTGRYEIDSGKYEMSLNQLIKRSFYIEKGSSISWNGDLLRGMLDISAKHTVNPPAIDLVRDQITSTTLNQIQYKQRIPVEIYLSIKDELLKPAIGFRLDMPEKDRNIFNGSVYTRLKQINNIPSELNKQVMGLLVLQSFISDNPLAVFNDRNEGGIAFAAKQSVSKILSQQINNLADNLIKGVDLNFDIQTREDYYTGERRESTSLSVAARKNLFNERLSVSVGSSIGLFGNNPEAANSLIGDLSIDYAISRDGRYKLRAYRKNQTDVILEGQIIESGLSFMLVVDYEKFSEIFKRSRKEQSRRKRK